MPGEDPEIIASRESFFLSEEGVTNLGPIPYGMSVFDAVASTKKKRKYKINIDHRSHRLTLCETLREVYREASKNKPNPERIKELAAAAFDFGKRMDARMKELKDFRINIEK